jgi:hypothetical protein
MSFKFKPSRFERKLTTKIKEMRTKIRKVKSQKESADVDPYFRSAAIIA